MTKKILSGLVEALGLYLHQTQITSTPVSDLGLYQTINLTDLVDKNDAGLNFDGQREDSSRQLLRLAVPHVSQRGGLEVNKLAARGFGCCLGDHGLPTSWGTKQQNTCKRKKKGQVRSGMLFLGFLEHVI